MAVDPNASSTNRIGINRENTFGVSPDPVGKRLASGWSSAATTQNSTFTTRTFFLDADIRVPFEVEVVTQGVALDEWPNLPFLIGAVMSRLGGGRRLPPDY